jgi:hypothetical protein
MKNTISIDHSILNSFYMHQPLLLPHRFKAIGLYILAPSVICWLLWIFDIYDYPFLLTGKGEGLFDEANYSLIEEILITGVAVGLLMIAFAQEKTEDEYVMTLRLQSLQWSVLANALLLLITNWCLFGEIFLQVMIYNMFTVLVIFILRFHYVLYRKQSPARNTFSIAPLYKRIGLAIVIPCILAHLLASLEIYNFPFLKTGRSQDSFMSNENYSFLDEILLTGMTIGLVMMAFAREKTEDEFIVSLRLRALQWAVLLNYALLLILNWFLFESNFMQMLIYNMFTVLAIFILWFNITLWKNASLTSE